MGGFFIKDAKYCEYCSTSNAIVYHDGKCPKVKKIHYHENGTVKLVEFFENDKNKDMLND